MNACKTAGMVLSRELLQIVILFVYSRVHRTVHLAGIVYTLVHLPVLSLC